MTREMNAKGLNNRAIDFFSLINNNHVTIIRVGYAR